jgi:hypothetical protein
MAAALVPGCANSWYYSFAEVEQERLQQRQAGRTQQDLLIFYKDHLDANSGQMEDVLRSPQVQGLISNKLRCILVTDYAPNQRYMARYRVDGVPALVVVHPDGSYHARSGLLSPEETQAFLEEAKPPGKLPQTDFQVLPVPEYYWHGAYEDARAIAARQNRSLLIVYKWWLSAESTELLNRLSQPRVQSQFSEMVHCMLDWDYVPNRAVVRQFGVDKVPAMIVVNPDGTHDALEGLATAEQIVQFAVRTRSRRRPAIQRGDRLGIKPAVHWQYNFERARATAKRQGRNLFVFYHSVFVDASNRSARLFDTPSAAAMLSSSVCCRLDWVVVKNRRLAAPFGLTEPPGYVVLRPDGTYHARSGPISVEGLEALLESARRPGARPRIGDSAS